MGKKWVVDVKIDDNGQGDVSYEFSIIREDNEHGFRSWGWDDGDEKIILFSDSYNAIEDREKGKAIAELFCDLMNKEE
jgi:hypothetical protein